MKQSDTSNPCPRCGQERIIQKTWNEQMQTTAGTSMVKHTMMVCPDPACQAKVEAGLAREQAKRQERQQAKDAQAQARQSNASAARVDKKASQ